MKRILTIASLACTLAFAVAAAIAYSHAADSALTPLTKVVKAIVLP